MRRTNTDTNWAPRGSRGAPAEDADLEWLLNKAAGEIGGLACSLGALAAMAQTGATRAAPGTRGIPRSVEGISARRAAAVDRERPLRLRFASLSTEHQHVLTLAYGERPTLAVDERQRLGQWAAVAPITKAALRGWEAEYRRREGLVKGIALKARELEAWRAKGLPFWLRGPATDADVLRAVREEARALVDAAWFAWSETSAPKQKRAPLWVKRERETAVERMAGRSLDERARIESGEYPIAPGVPWRRAG